MPSYNEDYDWQRQFIPEIKQILANYLIVESDPKEDRERCADLVVLRLDSVRVGCRVRKNKWVHKQNGRFLNEFTMRSSRPRSPHLIEHAKIISGWGDYFFYGFASPGDVPPLVAWFLGELKEFRLWHSRQLALGKQPWVAEKSNGDGSSDFKAFCVDDLPPEFVVARKRLTVTTDDKIWELF